MRRSYVRDDSELTTLYAKWTAKTYTITLDRQNGSGGSASATATYGSAMPAISVPTRTGYTFGGYYTAANGAGTQYYTAAGTSARNWDKTSATTLYAKWTDIPNDPPAIDAVSPESNSLAMTIGESRMFAVTAHDPDGDETTTSWYWRMEGDTEWTFCGNGAEFIFTPYNTGVNYMEARVSDGVSTVSSAWTVDVQSGGDDDFGPIGDSGLVWVKKGETITIAGVGAVPDGLADDHALLAHAAEIETIVVGDGVTGIGQNAFSSFPNVTTIVLPNSLTEIDETAFANCDNLEVLYLPPAFFDEIDRLGIPNACSVVGTDVHAFVKRLYSLCLGREPDIGGINDWSLQLAEGRNDGANVAYGFFMSQEMVNRHLSNEDFVEVLYNVMMNRASDAGGKAYWVDALDNGVSRAGALRGFAESTEFTQICGNYGINRGSLNRAHLEARDLYFGIAMFVARCYTKALGRAYDVDGLNYWCNAINSSPNPRATAVYVSTTGFFDSQEFQLRRLGNGAFVDVLYQTFLGRAADADGRADWVRQLDAGADRHAIMAGFYNSAEFNAIMAQYGL